jgi:hypothetical protein
MKPQTETTEAQTQPSEPEADNFPTLEEMSGIILQARARRERRLTRLVLSLEMLTTIAKQGVSMDLEWRIKPINQEQADMATKLMDVLYGLPIFQPDADISRAEAEAFGDAVAVQSPAVESPTPETPEPKPVS